MGIFNVSMPIIYGEGSKRAFMRLQTEIMNGSSDQTIFAWGRIHSDWNSAVENLWELMDRRITMCLSVEAGYPNGGLLALSPSQFALSADFRPIDPQTYLGLFGEAIDTNYTIMRNGATLRVPLTSDRAKVRSTVCHAAALACAVGEASIVLLFVARTFSWQLENSPFTCIGASVKLTEYPEFYRGAVLKFPYPLDQGYRYHLKSLRAESSYLSLRELRVGAAYRPDDSSNSLHLDRDLGRRRWTYNHLDGGGVELAFQLPPFVLSDLQKRYGFTQSTSKSPNSRDGLVLEADRKPRELPSRGGVRVWNYLSIPFNNPTSGERLTLSFGFGCPCNMDDRRRNIADDLPFPQLWLKVIMSTVVRGRVVSSTKLLPQDPEYEDRSGPAIRVPPPRPSSGDPHVHPVLLRRGHAPVVFRLPDHRAVHVACHLFHTRGIPFVDIIMSRFVVTVDLVGFPVVPEHPPRSPSPNASLVNADTTPIQVPDSSLPPSSPDTRPPMDRDRTGVKTSSVQARGHVPAPALMFGLGLARYAHAANHLIRAGLGAVTEWLGKEVDYTCGQLVWDEWAVGGV